MRYQVRNASWVPLYDARLATGTKTAPPKLDLTRRAAITQRTGESWDNVAAARFRRRGPPAGAAAPELNRITVDFEPEAKPAVAMVSAGADDRRRRTMAVGGAWPPRTSSARGRGAAAPRPLLKVEIGERDGRR